MEIKTELINEGRPPKIPGLIKAATFLGGTALGAIGAQRLLKPIDPAKRAKKKKKKAEAKAVSELKINIADWLPSIRRYGKRAKSLKKLADIQAEKTKEDIVNVTQKTKDIAKKTTKKVMGEAKVSLIKKAARPFIRAAKFAKKYPKTVAKHTLGSAGTIGLFTAADTATRIAGKEKEAKLALQRAHAEHEKEIGKRKAKKALLRFKGKKNESIQVKILGERKLTKKQIRNMVKIGAGALGVEMAAELGVEGLKKGTKKIRAKIKKRKQYDFTRTQR